MYIHIQALIFILPVTKHSDARSVAFFVKPRATEKHELTKIKSNKIGLRELAVYMYFLSSIFNWKDHRHAMTG